MTIIRRPHEGGGYFQNGVNVASGVLTTTAEFSGTSPEYAVKFFPLRTATGNTQQLSSIYLVGRYDDAGFSTITALSTVYGSIYGTGGTHTFGNVWDMYFQSSGSGTVAVNDYTAIKIANPITLTVNGTATALHIASITAGATNYAIYTNAGLVRFGGQVALAGDGRVTKQVPIGIGGVGKGAAAPAEVYLGNYMGLEFTINDTIYLAFEVPYDWDSSTDLEVEVHWYVGEDYSLGNGEVRWNLLYTATAENGTEAVDAATATVDSGDINIPSTAKYLTETELAIPAAALTAHDVVGCVIKRVALVGGSDPTAKPTITDIHIAYVANSLGEAV